MSSVKLNLREMLDIALPAPGMEVINFHILHRLLNAMIEALQMDEMQVDMSASSLIPTKDESTETVQTLDDENGNQMANYDEYGRRNQTPNQLDHSYIEAAENMKEKLSEMDTQITCLNDYVIQCMRVISASIGLKHLPRPSSTEAGMAADSILCEIIQTVDVVPDEAPMSERLTEMELDQTKQWDEVNSLSHAFAKYAKDTDALMEDVKLLKCKSKQMLDNYTRFAANTQASFETQNKSNETIDKKIKLVSGMLDREKKLTNCSLKGIESMLDQKVDRFDLESVKEYVKTKVKELSTRPNLPSRKADEDITEMKSRTNSDITKSDMKKSKPTVIDQINQQWKAYSDTLALFNGSGADMTACVCSYVKGANGSVYRTNCGCCIQKSKNLPNT